MVLAMAAPTVQGAGEVIDEGIEPPASFVLQVNEEKFNLKRGESLELKGEFKNPVVKLEVEPYKEFTYAGIYLKYPQNFGFEADLGDENVKMWNITGNAGILMIQKYNLEMDHKIMANLLVPRYGEANSKISECSLTFAGKPVQGTRVIANFGGSSISQEVYSFKQNEGSLLLIFQDSIDAKGLPTAEGNALKEIVAKTFKLK